MKGVRTIWTDEMIGILINEFPVSYNKELAGKLGVSWRTLIRKARELGVEKEPGFLDKRRPEITAMATKAHPGQKTKGLKGWSIPGGERFRFQKGHIPAIKIDPEVAAKVSRTRNEMIRKEKLRLKYGLRTMTKLNLKNYY